MKGGGKNFVSTVVFSYISYKLLCMRDPHAYFGRDGMKAMTLINVGANAAQGQKNFFEPLTQMFKRPGFAKWLAGKGFKPEDDIKKQEILLPKNIQLYSGHTNSSGIEGFDVLVGLVDECDSSEFTNAANIFRTLNTSSSTRFGARRKIMTISFRRYVGSSGVLKQLYSEFSQREKTTGTAYARRYATWEFNNKPGLRKSLQEYIENKPEEAACMVESKDDEGYYDSWIKDTDRIKNSMRRDRSWIFNMPVPGENWELVKDSEYSWVDKNGERRVLDPYNFPIVKRGNPKVKYILTGDPGLGNVQANGDSYGLTLAHREIIERNGKKWARPVIDFSFRFTGRMFDEGEIQFLAIENLIEKLNNMGYNIAIYSFDQWNSVSLVQWIRRKYPKAAIQGGRSGLVETVDYSALRDAIFSQAPPSKGKGDLDEGAGIDWPYHPIVYWELKELRVDRKKGKVDHQEHTSKDISDTIAKAVYIITMQWPFSDTVTTASGRDVAPEKASSLIKNQMQRNQQRDMTAVYSNSIGLGRFKR